MRSCSKGLLAAAIALPLYFVAVAAAQAQGQAAESVHAVLLADLDIDATGHVTNVAFKGKGDADPIARLVAERVRQWAFEPVLEDGVPVPVRTRASLELEAEQVPGGYALRVNGLDFGQRTTATHMDPPAYPKDALRRGIGGQVLLYVAFDKEGNSTESRVVSTSVGPSQSPGSMQYYAREFEKAAKRAARHWELQALPEVADDADDGTTALIPIEFIVPQAGAVAFIPVTDRSEVSQEIADRAARMPLANNQPLALESRVKLKDPAVVGSLL